MTTLGKITMAVRTHTGDTNQEQAPASNGEREVNTVAAVESARLLTGSVDVAIRVRDTIRAKSDEEWWNHEFLLHESVLRFVHHLL